MKIDRLLEVFHAEGYTTELQMPEGESTDAVILPKIDGKPSYIEATLAPDRQTVVLLVFFRPLGRQASLESANKFNRETNFVSCFLDTSNQAWLQMGGIVYDNAGLISEYVRVWRRAMAEEDSIT
jgi:hypothetical protein